VLQANAVKYFNALFNEPNANGISITASYMSSTSQIVVGGTASVPTNFMKVLGFQSVAIGGSSTATWGSNRLRVALVLDNTGSMADDGKMAALKSATKSLLAQLQSAATATSMSRSSRSTRTSTSVRAIIRRAGSIGRVGMLQTAARLRLSPEAFV
jgi:hypothetical protein